MKILLLSLLSVGLFAQPCLQQGTISSVTTSPGIDNTSTKCTTWTLSINTVGPVARYSAALQGDFGSGFVNMTAFSGSNPCTTVTVCTVTYVGLAPNTVRVNVTSFTSVPVGGSLAYGLSGSPPVAPTQTTIIINGQMCTLGSTCTIPTTPTGAAGGDLSGTYPNPGVAQLAGVAPPLPNSSLLNSSVTVNGTTCTLGSSCTPASGSTPLFNQICQFQASSNSNVPAICVGGVGGTVTIPANALNTIGALMRTKFDWTMQNNSGSGIGISIFIQLSGSTFTTVSFTLAASTTYHCTTDLVFRTVTTGSTGTGGFPGGVMTCNNATTPTSPAIVNFVSSGDVTTNFTTSNAFSFVWSSNTNGPMTMNDAVIALY